MPEKRIDPIESEFLGKWRIAEMPDFVQEAIDQSEPACRGVTR